LVSVAGKYHERLVGQWSFHILPSADVLAKNSPVPYSAVRCHADIGPTVGCMDPQCIPVTGMHCRQARHQALSYIGKEIKGINADADLRLIGKRVVDFLLVLIDLFC